MISFYTSIPAAFSLRMSAFEIKNFFLLLFASFFPAGLFPCALSNKDLWIQLLSPCRLLFYCFSSYFPQMTMGSSGLSSDTHGLDYVAHCKCICYFSSPLTIT